MQHEYDVAIIGAGMVGASLACALAPGNLKIAIVEPVKLSSDIQPSYDDRGIALSLSSKRILESLGVWQQVEPFATPIKKIHVTEQGRFGSTHIDTSRSEYNELGFVVIARSLGQALHNRLSELNNVSLICPAELKHFQQNNSGMFLELAVAESLQGINTKLLVGADGNNSLVRRLAGLKTDQYDFNQTAIVANITTQKDNNATAYERFTPHGPIALLPIGRNRSVLVFTVSRDNSERYLSMSDEQFIEKVESEFGRRLGKINQLGTRKSYPIVFMEAIKQYQQSLVLLGNAAHTIHPNAAQGFNLGLRDVAGLAECIFTGIDRGLDLDDLSILESYIKLRSLDQQHVMQFTTGLARSFYNQFPLLSDVRHLALVLLDVFPVVKDSFMEKAMGVSGLQPGLVRGHA
ncbi:MAG: 2-octaprenyl-6-methoxyphenyl hydroxylase [Proteobacteria bacterium]|nr:2-octaprenyl-6-methoxyphenyl hydroxylase [Pseudomonadota bacterium]